MKKKPGKQQQAEPRSTSGTQPKRKAPANGTSFAAKDWIPFILVCLYAAVDFIPGSATADVMGNQWLYLAIINITCIGFFAVQKDIGFSSSVKNIFSSALSLLYSVFFIVAGLSIAFAFNKTESMVCYARLVNTVIMYFNLAILLYNRLHLFRYFAQALAIVLLLQSLQVLSQFFNGMGETSINTLIYNLKLNAGNKNILAAGLVMKFPFALYCIYSFRLWGRIINTVILLPAAMAVFILNARASYLALILGMVCFIILCLLTSYKKASVGDILAKTIVPALPVIIAFFLSAQLIKNAIAESDVKTPYGTVTQRLSSISFTASGSDSRVMQWTSALEYIRKHPVIGCGFGNWKLASIPYEKTFVDDLLVTYHVHNDFLETTAETGLLGGVLYLAIFACALLYLLKAVFSPVTAIHRAVALIAVPSLAIYAVDAFFNFPMERPVMQFFFALPLALTVNLFLITRGKNNLPTANSSRQPRKIYAFLSILVLIPALYVTYLTCKSLIAQAKVNKDMTTNNPETKWQDIMDIFPSIPNMNAYCFPIDEIKAFYLVQDKKYDEALQYADKGRGINPSLSLDEYLRAKIYFETSRPDSAFKYAQAAFTLKPRSKTNFDMLNRVCTQKNDTLTLTRAFREYIHYRNEPWAWDQYIASMVNMKADRVKLLQLADSALLLFPDDANLKGKKNDLQVDTHDSEFRKYFNAGLEAFSHKNFAVAVQDFNKAAELNPDQYLATENAGLAYYSLKNYGKALECFNNVIQSKKALDGKSEFFKGLTLLNTGKKEDACTYFKIADNRHFANARQYVTYYCQPQPPLQTPIK